MFLTLNVQKVRLGFEEFTGISNLNVTLLDIAELSFLQSKVLIILKFELIMLWIYCMNVFSLLLDFKVLAIT